MNDEAHVDVADEASSEYGLSSEFLQVRSDALNELRSLVDSWQGLRSMISGAACFVIVVDTNVVIGDLLWLVMKRRNPQARTELMEIIAAGTAEVYAPPRLLKEIREQLPRIAEQKGVDVEKLFIEWESYRKCLKIEDPGQENIGVHVGGVDPDDADFLALSDAINAAGIFSKDKHINMMGGNQISVKTIASLRDYSRASAIELTLKVNGVVITFIGLTAIRELFSGFRSLIASLNRAPEWVKIALIVGGVFAAIHPGSRDYLARKIRVAFSGIRGLAPDALDNLAQAIALMQDQQNLARGHLNSAMRQLEKK